MTWAEENEETAFRALCTAGWQVRVEVDQWRGRLYVAWKQNAGVVTTGSLASLLRETAELDALPATYGEEDFDEWDD